MLEKIILVITLGALSFLLVLLQMTTPSTAGPAGILAVFFLLYLFFLGLFTWIIQTAGWVLGKLMRPVSIKKRLTPPSLSHSYYLSSVLAIAPIMLIGIGSVGEFNLYEIMLVILFIGIGFFYVQKHMR